MVLNGKGPIQRNELPRDVNKFASLSTIVLHQCKINLVEVGPGAHLSGRAWVMERYGRRLVLLLVEIATESEMSLVAQLPLSEDKLKPTPCQDDPEETSRSDKFDKAGR